VNNVSLLNLLFIRDIFRAVRMQNLLILVFAQYFASIFLNDSDGSSFEIIKDWRLFLLSLSTVLVAAGGYVINDYYDIKIDLVNKPEKVVVGKIVTRRIAMFLHTTLSFAGIAVGAFISLYLGAINFVSAFLLWWYSNYLKRLPFLGNLVIGFLSGLAIMLVAILYPEGTRQIAIYSFFAGFFTLIREVIKDMEDLSGDHRFGYRTLPVVWGIRKTKQFLFLMILVFATTVLYFTYSDFGARWLEMNLGLLILNIFFVYKLVQADTKKDFGWLSQYCKMILFLGILSMVFIT